jgi:hypothetical protein
MNGKGADAGTQKQPGICSFTCAWGRASYRKDSEEFVSEQTKDIIKKEDN